MRPTRAQRRPGRRSATRSTPRSRSRSRTTATSTPAARPGGEAWVAELDSCDGGIIREKTFAVPGATGVAIYELHGTPTQLFACGGAAQPNAVYGNIDRALTTPHRSRWPPGTANSSPGLLAHRARHRRRALAVGNRRGRLQLALAGLGGPRHGAGARPRWVSTPSSRRGQGRRGSMYVMVDSAAGTSQVSLMDLGLHAGRHGRPAADARNDDRHVVALRRERHSPRGGHGRGHRIEPLCVPRRARSHDEDVDGDDAGPQSRGARRARAGRERHELRDLPQRAVSQRAGFGTGTATVYRFVPPYTTTSVPATTTLPVGAKQIAVRAVAVAPAGQDGVYVRWRLGRRDQRHRALPEVGRLRALTRIASARGRRESPSADALGRASSNRLRPRGCRHVRPSARAQRSARPTRRG